MEISRFATDEQEMRTTAAWPAGKCVELRRGTGPQHVCRGQVQQSLHSGRLLKIGFRRAVQHLRASGFTKNPHPTQSPGIVQSWLW